MKHLYYALLAAVSLAGCSSASHTTQTPDDVYYSPATGKERAVVSNANQAVYENYNAYTDDRYLAMKVHNHLLWSSIDDYNYWYNPQYSYFAYPQYGYFYSFQTAWM